MLDLSRIDMSEVDLELLAEAVAGVNRVNLYGTNLSNQLKLELTSRLTFNYGVKRKLAITM